MLCCAGRYRYAFDTCCGKPLLLGEGPLGSHMVLSLLNNMETQSDHHVFLDNFFRSHELLTSLSDKGTHATATIHKSRQKKCPPPPRREIQRVSWETMGTVSTHRMKSCLYSGKIAVSEPWPPIMTLSIL